MTLGEFRAWLNGYECSFDLNADGYWPNAKQFTEIKEKLALVDKPPVFVQMPGRLADMYKAAAAGGGPFIPKDRQNVGQLLPNITESYTNQTVGLCAPATISNMDDWDNRNIYNQLTGKPI